MPFRHTVMYRPTVLVRWPALSGAVISFSPDVYPRSPEADTTAVSGVQVIRKPGIAKLLATMDRMAAFPCRAGCPGPSTRASSAQYETMLSTLPDRLVAAQARSTCKRVCCAAVTSALVEQLAASNEIRAIQTARFMF